MKITARQKAAIRGHWSSYWLRFLEDGSIEARKSLSGSWGVLYTPAATEKHLRAVGLLEAAK